jgi:hypothetical protein
LNLQKILSSLSAKILADEEVAQSLPDEVRESGWLGFPACSDHEIRSAEMRLGVTLPNTLRDFYLLTNGWRNLNEFVYAILPVEKIDVLPNVDRKLADAINASSPDGSYFKMMRELNSHIEVPEIDVEALTDPELFTTTGVWFSL